jgi:hypothetical protein
MKDRVVMLEQQLCDKESQVGYLRQEYSKINDALTRRLLTEAKPTLYREHSWQFWRPKKPETTEG